MPRGRIVTSDGLIDLLESIEKPFADVPDIADHFDVSEQAIHNARERFLDDDRIESVMVGNSRVYFLADSGPEIPEEESNPEGPPPQTMADSGGHPGQKTPEQAEPEIQTDSDTTRLISNIRTMARLLLVVGFVGIGDGLGLYSFEIATDAAGPLSNGYLIVLLVIAFFIVFDMIEMADIGGISKTAYRRIRGGQ